MEGSRKVASVQIFILLDRELNNLLAGSALFTRQP